MLGFGPLGSLPLGALPYFSINSSFQFQSTFLEAATEQIFAATLGFISEDNPLTIPERRNIQFMPTFDGAFTVHRSISSGGNGYSGFSQTVTELSLLNDGLYDEIPDGYSINGQSITLTAGLVTGRDTVAPYNEFETVAVLHGERMTVSRSALTLQVGDLQVKLDVPVQTNVYKGTGGLEGGPELEGKRRPRGFGKLSADDQQGGNVSPVLVIVSEGLWQVSDRPIASIEAVKDGGVPMDFLTDFPTVAALRAASVAGTIVPGQWASCLADGYIVIGVSIYKQITVDFTSVNLTTADIIEEVALSSAGLSANDLDAYSFEQLNVIQPAVIGYYLDQNSSETCADMFTKLMNGIGGWHGVNLTGQLQVKRFDAPVAIASDYLNTNGLIIDVDGVPLPESIDPPPQRSRVVYARNWTVQTDVFGKVSETEPDLASYLSKPYKTATTTDEQSQLVLNDYPNAPDPVPLESFFAYLADAQEEADRRWSLYASGFKTYRASVKHVLFRYQLGEVVNISDSRLGLSDGRYIRIVELTDDIRAGTTEIIGFGGRV